MDCARFARHVRLSNKVEFGKVFEQHTKSGDIYFTVLVRPNELGFSRLGLAISRKSARTAVARNRIKRVIRESFRHHQQQLGSRDFVVIGRENLAGYSNAIFFDSLERHWLRLTE